MIKSFEGLRGLAAVLVALFHLYSSKLFSVDSLWFSAIRNGYIFVDLFFIMSGFIISSAYSGRLRDRDEVLAFIIRRFGRLFPLLIFATIAYIVVYNGWNFSEGILRQAWTGQGAGKTPAPYLLPNVPEIMGTITLTHGLGIFDRLILNYASWSISTEFYAYLLFALCFVRLNGRSRFLVLAIACLACLAISAWASIFIHHCRSVGECGNVTYDFGFLRCVGCFILGIFVYSLPKPAARITLLLQAVALAATAMLFASTKFFSLTVFSSPIVFALLIYSLSADTGPLASVFKITFCQMLGQRSYSIYLLHPVILLVFYPVLKSLGHSWQFKAVLLAYLPIVIIAAGWTYRYIEDPMRKYFNSLAEFRRSRKGLGAATERLR